VSADETHQMTCITCCGAKSDCCKKDCSWYNIFCYGNCTSLEQTCDEYCADLGQPMVSCPVDGNQDCRY
jgi:hypothetical protein